MDLLDTLVAALDADRETATPWDPDFAVELCRLIEGIAPKYGAHVALTGGCLYKDGPRKDCDILFYRIRQTDNIDQGGLVKELAEHGMKIGKVHGWVIKASWEDRPVDLFFPEQDKISNRYRSEPCTHVELPDPMVPESKEVTCPKCYQPMIYSINQDSWVHPTVVNIPAPGVSVMQTFPSFVPDVEPTTHMVHTNICVKCNKTYHYLDGYDGLPYCPKCNEQVAEQDFKDQFKKSRTQLDDY
jgi:formylmethanofuran dehydrogenase subunit E